MFRLCAALLLCVVSGLLHAQTWNSNAGGYNTGYGTVYGSFGLAQATRNIYNSSRSPRRKSDRKLVPQCSTV